MHKFMQVCVISKARESKVIKSREQCPHPPLCIEFTWIPLRVNTLVSFMHKFMQVCVISRARESKVIKSREQCPHPPYA